eukprot:TRINITY_DN3533_c0_g1_i2.p1 TRINITY_DN3533_c0_g1~~TRINITY_DN3533_c0_g1_i2.p1  ORF type:complete len:297 (+),score=47.62 TRINITY_DN3533_c0_g1_i2:56-946(+)
MAFISKDDKVLKEGWLKKSNYKGHLTKAANRRYIVLTDRYLDWYIAPRDKRKGTLPVTNLLCRMQDGASIVVGYADGSKEWKLQAESMDSRAEIEDWYKVICSAIDNVRSLDRKYSTTQMPVPQADPNQRSGNYAQTTVTQQQQAPAPMPMPAPAPMPMPAPAPMPAPMPAYQQTTTYSAPAPMPAPAPVYQQTTTYSAPAPMPAPAPMYTQTTYVQQAPPPMIVPPPMQTTTTTYSPFGAVTQTYVQPPVVVAPPPVTYTTTYAVPQPQVTQTRVIGPYGHQTTTYTTNMPPPFY